MFRISIILLITIPFLSFSQEVEDKRSRYPLFELTKGDENTKNLNWGNYHYSNESYRKALDRYEKIDNPNVEIQRKMGLAYREIGSLDVSMAVFEKLIDNGKDVKPQDYLVLSQLQDINGLYSDANKNRKKYARLKAREIRVSLFETDEEFYQRLLNTLSEYDLKNLEINTELSDFGGYALRSGKDGQDISMIFSSSGTSRFRAVISS